MNLDLFGSGSLSGSVEDQPIPAPPEPPRPKTWTVSQVNRAVRRLLEETVEPLWITGELANWTRARSGHCYFSLKDEQAQLRCVMFRAEALMLPVDPEVGMTLRAWGGLTLYEGRGEYQLVVRRLEGEGEEGLWRLAFEKLRAKLDAEGLLSADRKRPIPRFPTTVGVVTSPTGAALHDIVKVIQRRAPWTRVLLRGARVQGEGAAREIATALHDLVRQAPVDVVIVGRGGGSTEDLWAFNEEEVARAISECPVPVISAVGHEVDVTISDLVADLRAPTPSAAAEAAVPDGTMLRTALGAVGERLEGGLLQAVRRRRVLLEDGRRRLAAAAAGLVPPHGRTVSRLKSELERIVRVVVRDRRSRLVTASATMDVLSPLSTLQRGYAIPTAEGRILRTVADFAAARRFDLRLAEGSVSAQTLSTTSEPETDD